MDRELFDKIFIGFCGLVYIAAWMYMIFGLPSPFEWIKDEEDEEET